MGHLITEIMKFAFINIVGIHFAFGVALYK
jgi:hypothetical protein